MSNHLPECPGNWGVGQMPDGPCTLCDMLRACEQRVLDAARQAVAALHRPVPVIECGGTCGWGKDCPECGIQSNRIVGYVCDACCNSFGDHAYCDDLHHEDTPLHHQDGQMWSGPHCPVIAAIDALKEKQ